MLQFTKDMFSEVELEVFQTFGPDVMESLSINLNEWLLAEGFIHARGEVRRINDYLLSPSGPQLTPGQRHFIHELGQRPLRLYDVTDVTPGQQMTVCDAINRDAAPMVVRERSGTRNLRPGALLGCRVIRIGDHFELSGSTYLFAELRKYDVVEKAQALIKGDANPLDAPRKMGLFIFRQWIEQWILPPPAPTLTDRYTGEPITFITDHYTILDGEALMADLLTQPDLEGDSVQGMDRVVDCSDGEKRRTLSMEWTRGRKGIRLHYKTQGYADAGREWFGALAGKTVKFRKRVIMSAEEMMDELEINNHPPTTHDPMDPALEQKLIREAYQKFYANWADEPIPALGNKTPRECIKTSAGLERVEGLIRSYEENEKRLSHQNRKAPFSFDFLWQSLGLQP